MRVERFAGLAAFGAGVLILAGCDGNMAEVKGSVKFDGKMIEKGAIQFYPADGKGTTAGGEIKDGQYSVKVPVGVMRVHFSYPRVVGKKKLYDTPNSPERPIYEESIPEKYSSRDKTELQLEVKPGINEKDWDLQSK